MENKMNISSVVITLKDKSYMQKVSKNIQSMPFCELVTSENEKIVVVISSEDFDSQISSYKKLESIKEVANVVMIYNFEDTQKDIKDMQDMQEIGDKINVYSDAKNIVYGGDVNKKIK